MAERDIETRIKAVEEYASSINVAEKNAVSAASRIEERFGGLSTALKQLSASLSELAEKNKNFTSAANEVTASLEGAKNAIEKALSGGEGADSKSEVSWYNPFWFLTKDKTKFNEAIKSYKESLGDLKLKANEEFTALAGYNELHEASISSRKNVTTKAYDAMAEQMLKQIEHGEFSANAFARAVSQQVKIELVGLAARAAIWALFESAMGFATLFSNSAASWAHFKSAAEFAAISGASYIAAKQVNNIQEKYFAPEEDKSNSVAGAPKGARLSGATAVPVSLSSEAQPRQTQHITIQIYNPLSEQNWEKIAEENIIPAINSAVNRNVVLTVR
ncbi:MAG: hypothetical protein NUW09_09790 [Deltaproteobacteria bacterium]|nr:hypothetical protein [Deltaproteobacteria bacterium]